ncbi:hypothetical protein Tco_1064368 [Tanacetum coccineum]
MSVEDNIAVQRCVLSAKELNEFLSLYPIPSEYDVILPTSTQTIFDAPFGYVDLYTHSFSLANLRLPYTEFFCVVLQYFKVHISRLNPFGYAKLTTFIIMCKAYGYETSIDLFRGFFNLCQACSWLTFQKRSEKHIPNLLPKDLSLGFGIDSPSASVNTKLPKDVEEHEVQPAEITVNSRESLKSGVFIVHPGSVAARIKERKCKTRGGSSRPHVKRKLASGSSSSRAVSAKTSASKDDAPILSISDDDEGLPDYFELKDANLTGGPEECEELRVKCEAAMAEFDQNPTVLVLREKISLLTADVKEHKGNLDRMMLESQKWADEFVADVAAPIEALLSKKPPTL